MTARWVRVAAPLLCLAGLGVSLYLTIAHYNAKVTLACPETGIVNCAKVTESPQSAILGVPVALLGLLYFVAITPLHLPAAWRSESGLVRRARVGAAVAGILMVLYLVYTELFTLDALCLWCTAVHGITFLLFVVTLVGTMQMAPEAELVED
ncbi:MAG: Vitamin epoxide reductase [Actinobacteria bacterium]|nr:Vitamin epoxide reductase [Actinomycetota bacterium]